MSEEYCLQEDRVKHACSEYQENPELSIAHLAREWEVPYQVLRCRINGRSSRLEIAAKGRKLSDHQEEALVAHIKELEEMGIPMRPRHLAGAANRILRTHADPPNPNPSVSPNWSRRFLQRRPDLFEKKATLLSVLRKAAHDPAELRSWFRKLQQVIQKAGIQKDDIYNMDETGYRPDCGRSKTIITTKPGKRVFICDPDNRIHITSIECISAGGYILSSHIILTGVQITQNVIVPELDHRILLSTSLTGYSNDEIAME